MSNQRTHYATTSDGVTIAGTVHGRGPALVFLQGIIGDSDLDWGRTIAGLTDRFTCHLPSMRGRGLSGDSADLDLNRLIADFVTYVESIGEPVGLVGWSGGGNWALYVAAQSGAVRAVAPFEPGMLHLLDEQEQAVLGDALARTGALASSGRLPAAARAFAGWPFTDKEMQAAEDAGYFAAAGRYVPNLLSTIQQAVAAEPPPGGPEAPLRMISAPVMVLVGSETRPFFFPMAQFVVDHVPNARIQEIPGAGHAAPLTHPEALADALAEFFSRTGQPAAGK